MITTVIIWMEIKMVTTVIIMVGDSNDHKIVGDNNDHYSNEL